MACPKCGCKTTYTYTEDDILGLPGDQERCPNCRAIFYVDDSAEDDEDDDMPPPLAIMDALTDRPRISPGVAVIEKCVRLPPNGRNEAPAAPLAAGRLD